MPVQHLSRPDLCQHPRNLAFTKRPQRFGANIAKRTAAHHDGSRRFVIGRLENEEPIIPPHRPIYAFERTSRILNRRFKVLRSLDRIFDLADPLVRPGKQRDI